MFLKAQKANRKLCVIFKRLVFFPIVSTVPALVIFCLIYVGMQKGEMQERKITSCVEL